MDINVEKARTLTARSAMDARTIQALAVLDAAIQRVAEAGGDKLASDPDVWEDGLDQIVALKRRQGFTVLQDKGPPMLTVFW